MSGPFSNSEYSKFMKEYRTAHRACPKCGNTSHTTTLVAYILDMSRKDAYKDMNKCECICGDVHTVHDRVPFEDTCLLCDTPAVWIRHTQFAGSHPFCDKHANLEKDFKDENSDNYWENLKDDEEESEDEL